MLWFVIGKKSFADLVTVFKTKNFSELALVFKQQKKLKSIKYITRNHEGNNPPKRVGNKKRRKENWKKKKIY